MAAALAALSLAALLGWATASPLLLRWSSAQPPISIEAALDFLLLASALLGLGLGWRRAAMLAWIPVGLGLWALVETALGSGPVLGEWLVHDRAFLHPDSVAGMPPAAALALLWVGLNLVGVLLERIQRWRSFSMALTGSVVAAVGVSTLGGHALEVPAVYRWGGTTPIPVYTAIGLVLLGAALLALAGREHRRHRADVPLPTWLPIPVATAAITLTAVLWTALRERETVYLSTNTQVAVNTLATSINTEIARQSGILERLARRWRLDSTLSALPESAADASTLARDSRGICRSISWIDPALTTREVFPVAGNEEKAAFGHATDPVRRDAAALARQNGTPAVSGNVLVGPDALGFAIYVPVFRDNQLAGYLAGEYDYGALLDRLVDLLDLQGNYRVEVSIGGTRIFGGSATAVQLRSSPFAIDAVYTIAARRVRLTLDPTPELLARTRRYLPELALAAGLGITLLLTLTVHLARAAYARQLEAERSNRRIVAENEERRRVEAMLKISDERLRLALESTQIGIFEWDIAAATVHYSPGVWLMLGYEPARMPATPEAWINLVHPDDLADYNSALEKHLAGASPLLESEFRVRAHDGGWHWIYSRAKAIHVGFRGEALRILGTLQDVSGRRQAEQALRASQAEARKLSLVASRTDNLVILCSPDGRVDWVNESFGRFTEYLLPEVAGSRLLSLLEPDTDPHTAFLLETAFVRGEAVNADVISHAKSGRRSHLHLELQPVRNEAGRVENFIALAFDVTARVEMEHQLRRAKVEADAASRAKSEFLASMSHEIRTPMNGVIGMTSLLLETPLNDEQRDFVSTIRSSGEALLTIINDILDFSKIESGKLEIEHLPFDLTGCIEDAFDLFAAFAASKDIELGYCVDPAVSPCIVGDVTRLRQVLVNLVNNAIKFTPAGSVTVEVRLAAVDAAAGLVLEFAVRDTGIGIPPDRLDRLFRPFSQIDSSTTRKYGGTGLGLAICHRLCTLMGGEINVRSSLGEGSTFTFTMPTQRATPPADAGLPLRPPSLASGHLLCVEDIPIHQRRIDLLLRAWGVTARPAASSAAALAQLAQAPTPRAAIVELSLLEQDAGPALKTRLQQLGVPLLILLPTTRDARPDFGSLPVITVSKPLKNYALLRGLQTLLQAQPTPSPAPPPPPDPRLLADELPLDVLLVEDNAVNQKVALHFLQRLGYRADAVGNGLEALTTLQNRRYHLVLMDLQMPEMDGFEATREIRRQLPPKEQPKIVALTANALQGDRELCLACGMDDYITKPIKLRELVDAIRRQFAPKNAPA